MKSSSKLLISVLLGLGGLWFSLLSPSFNNPPFSLTFTWSFFLPLLASMAFGPLYGLAAGFLGLGAFYPFLLYPNNGWGNLVTVIVILLWLVWSGYFNTLHRRMPLWWNHPFLIQIPFGLFYILFIRVLTPLAYTFNPPPWNPLAFSSIPLPVLDGMAIEGAVMMYLVIITDAALLKTNEVRALFGLEQKEEARRNGRIVLGSVAISFILWFTLILFNAIFIDNDFPLDLVRVGGPQEILALVVFSASGFFFATIICQFMEPRLLVERALEKSEENYRRIFEQAADGIFIADEQRRFVEVNESGCRLLGYTLEELRGMNMRDLVMVEDESMPAWFKSLEKGKVVAIEKAMRRKDGVPVWVEISAVKLADGRLQGVVRDITQRKRAEEELRASHGLLTEFIRHSPIYAYIKEVTPKESITLFASENYKEMIGIPAQDMIGKNMFALFPPEFAAKITADEWAVVSQGLVLVQDETLNDKVYTTIKFPVCIDEKTFLAGYTIDITARNRDKQELESSQAELRRLLDETELSRRALLSLVEDTKEAEDKIRHLNTDLERRVAERTTQLAAANKELEAFAYSVSHDLRGPLRALDGFSAALSDDYGEQLDERAQRYLRLIQESSQRMGQLINDLLDLSKVTQVELCYQPVDLSAVCRAVASELIAQTPDRHVEVQVAPDLSTEGDANLLKIAISNLLNNAFKFTGQREQAFIQIGAVDQEGKQVYFIRDNGTGFPMEYAHKLFAPFQRLHSTQEFPGTGIGLSIVSRIITRHGGRIWPESTPGEGTTFYFTLKE